MLIYPASAAKHNKQMREKKFLHIWFPPSTQNFSL